MAKQKEVKTTPPPKLGKPSNAEDSGYEKKLALKAKDIWENDASDRSTLLNHCQECANYFLPRRSTITIKKEMGSKRSQRVLRSVGMIALRTWSTGLMNGIFPSGSMFHANRIRGLQIEDTPVIARKWLEDTATAQYEAVINSNFGYAMGSAFLDEGAFGTSCIFIGEAQPNSNELVYFKNFSIENYTFTEDYTGKPNCVVCMDSFTTKQLVERFGIDAIPKHINKSDMYDGRTIHKVIFAVMPNEKYDAKKTLKRGLSSPNNRPFSYVYFTYEGMDVLESGGYYELPFVITRINKCYDEKFGRSPAMDALNEIKMLNKTAEYDIAATERLIRPSYIVDNTSVMGPINPQPGTITIADMSKVGSPVIPFPTAENPAWGERQEQSMTMAVNAIFMTDVFRTLSADKIAQPNITMFQLQLAKNEGLSQLGPLLSINEREKISPMMDRVFGILWRNGMIPDPPESIAGLEFNAEPTSPIFSAVTNAPEVDALNRQIGYCAQVMQVQPDIWDNIDLDAGFNLISASGGTAARTTRSADDRDKIREERVRAQQQQAAIQLAMQQQAQQQQGV